MVLERVDGDSVVEKFGSKINSSFFDAANALGTLKQKGLIDLVPQFPGPTTILFTEEGKEALSLAKKKSKQELDKLDDSILLLISRGFNDQKTIGEKLNMRGSDVALHLYRLVAQDFASAAFRSGRERLRMELVMTDKGYKRIGYFPLGTDEERKQSEAEVASLISAPDSSPRPGAAAPSHAAAATPQAPPVPLTLDARARMRAKAEYYAANSAKYVIVILVIAALAFIAAAYFLYFGK